MDTNSIKILFDGKIIILDEEKARLFLDMFSDVNIENNKETKIPSYIIELKTILETNFRDPITLDLLESKLGISKFRLCREFKSYYSNSPLQYLNGVRLQNAMGMLMETEMTINFIGDSVGIPNTSHFIKLFKRQTGHTPAEYRKIIKTS